MSRRPVTYPVRTQALIDRLDRLSEQKRRLETQVDDVRRQIADLSRVLIEEKSVAKTVISTHLKTSRARLDEMLRRYAPPAT